MLLYALAADRPLTKTYTKKGTELIKSPYPMTWEFTSHKETVTTLKDLERVLVAHASQGHCVLKGLIARDLVCESRAGSTNSNDTTEWMVLDLDGLPEHVDVTTTDKQLVSTQMSIPFFMDALGLGDVSYIVQWSASYGISDKKVRAHIFILLDKPYAAPLIKQWLIQKNHEVSFLADALTLTKTGNTLSWPLDTSACQNDKLIYISPPNLKGIKDPMGKTPRIQLVRQKIEKFVLSSKVINSAEKNKKLTHDKINVLRKHSGMPERKFTTKVVNGQEVMLKPDEAVITEMKVDRGFVYFNLNGGDSWAYYHPEDRPDYIYNFKGEPTYLTKELLPGYWQELTSAGNVRVSSSGITYLAFCDRKTGIYWRGTYDATTDVLDITVAKNETQLRHFAKQFGVPLGDFVPEWDLTFDPNSTTRVDLQNRVVNKFSPSVYMKQAPKKVTKCPPTIFKIMHHALGCDVDITEHFVNWVSYILQKRDRTRTAWVLHGTQGCLAGETEIEFNRGKRNGGRPLSIKKAYEKWNGTFKQGTGLGKGWDLSIPTRAKSVRDGMTIGYHEVFKIVESGEKQLYKLTGSHGASIRATELHPFMRPDGSFTPLNELKPGDEIVIEGAPVKHYGRGGRKAQRTTIHSIPFHPHAWQHIINGKNYKRSHRARLVVEAGMNGLSLEEFIQVLRTDEQCAANLVYLAPTEIVHHLDEDVTNDSYNNLMVIDKANHDAHHAKEVGLGYISTRVVTVKSVKKDKVEMTYDMVMKAPYHNYIANGFAVHNTGKGILTNNILRPIFGLHTTSRRMEELNEKYNHFMSESLIVFVDEVQIKSLGNERGVQAKLKNFITEEYVPIRAMHANAMEQRNYTNWIFMSNMPDPVPIDKGDRRHNVGKYQDQKLVVTPDEILAIEKELQAFHDYLANYPTDEERAGQVIHTADRDTMITLSESSIDTAATALLEGNFAFFIDQLPTTNSYTRNALSLNRVESYTQVLKDLMLRTKPDGKCNISRDELRTLLDYVTGNMPDSPNKFTSLLKHHRMHTLKVWVDNRPVYGLSLRWMDVAEFPNYTKTHFKKEKV